MKATRHFISMYANSILGTIWLASGNIFGFLFFILSLISMYFDHVESRNELTN